MKPVFKAMASFYETFFAERYDVRVRGFSYRDKRTVARRLVREEDRQAEGGDLPAEAHAALRLATAFEDLSDLLHGDVEFGYSDDAEDYLPFHREVFPDWLRRLETWLVSVMQPDLAKRVASIERRYRDAFDATS